MLKTNDDHLIISRVLNERPSLFSRREKIRDARRIRASLRRRSSRISFTALSLLTSEPAPASCGPKTPATVMMSKGTIETRSIQNQLLRYLTAIFVGSFTVAPPFLIGSLYGSRKLIPMSATKTSATTWLMMKSASTSTLSTSATSTGVTKSVNSSALIVKKSQYWMNLPLRSISPRFIAFMRRASLSTSAFSWFGSSCAFACWLAMYEELFASTFERSISISAAGVVATPPLFRAGVVAAPPASSSSSRLSTRIRLDGEGGERNSLRDRLCLLQKSSRVAWSV